jgi:hypothetical protein
MNNMKKELIILLIVIFVLCVIGNTLYYMEHPDYSLFGGFMNTIFITLGSLWLYICYTE